MTKRNKLRAALLATPGLRTRDLSEMLPGLYHASHVLTVELGALKRLGDVELVRSRWYLSARFLERGPRRRGRPPAVRALDDGRIYILGQRLKPEHARAVHEALGAVLEGAA